jgi:hypothetical protein
MNGIVKMIKMNHWLLFFLPLFMLTSNLAAAGDNQPVKLTGKWQLSWEARIGTESGAMQLEQVDSKLTGSYQGHLVSSKLSGTVQDKNVTLNLDFAGAHPFTIIFTGTVDGDKMGGKFSIGGAKDGYDSYGENARPTDYSWKAIRQPDQTQSDSGQANRTNRK